jgi:Putative porin
VILRIVAILVFFVTAPQAIGQRPQFPTGPGRTNDEIATPPGGQRKPRSGKGSIFLNDTTRNVYGPNTTLQTTEQDIFFNRAKYGSIDTSIVNLHRWGYVQRFNYRFQDLGNVGTALNPIFPVVGNFAGAVSGFNAYRLYFDTQEPMYLDTKSPYTKINVIWGGRGRAMTHIQFSRNINPRWNFGFNYRPILVDKQLLRQRRGDRHVMAHYYDFHTSYRSKNEKYLLLFNLRRTRHRVFENGGVMLKPNDTFAGYFDPEAGPVLVAAETSQFLRNFHLLNQYSLAKAFQVYVRTDLKRESNNFSNRYESETNRRDTTLFDNWEKVKTDTLNAGDMLRFSTFENELGIKGRAAFLFYDFYYKFRTFSQYNRHDYSQLRPAPTVFNGSPLAVGLPYQAFRVNLNAREVEHYIGSRIAFDIDSLTTLSGQAEINQRGNYSIDAKFESKWIEASFVQSIARPGLLYTSYRGAHDFWDNSFRDIAGLKLEGFLKTPFKKYLVSPGLSYTLLSNYVYFSKGDFNQRQTVLPVQSGSVINVANPQLRLGLALGKKLRLSGSVINNLILTDDEGAMKIPDWLATGQLAWEDVWFKKNLQVQCGFDVTWRSAYQAMGYDVAIQQFYVQNDVTVGSALIADAFLNGKLKRGRLFVKYHNIMQLLNKTGYLVTPNYPGQRNILDFGFEFMLFD